MDQQCEKEQLSEAYHKLPTPKNRQGVVRPSTDHTARRKLLPIAPHSLATAPSLTLVQDAPLSFARDSAAGPSGLRPQHIKGPSSCVTEMN